MQFMGIQSEADRPISLKKDMLLASSVSRCLRGEEDAGFRGSRP